MVWIDRSSMNDTEVLVTCPYNRAHTIIRSRMQFHLTKCRQQSTCYTDMVTCPFNSTHVVNRVELDVHQEICPNRIVLDSVLSPIGDSTSPQGVVPVTSEIPIPESDENWDDNPVETSVLDVVKTSAKDKSVLLNLIGAPKSERKAHRIQERIRFQQVAGQERRFQYGNNSNFSYNNYSNYNNFNSYNRKKEQLEKRERRPDFTYNNGKWFQTIFQHDYRLKNIDFFKTTNQMVRNDKHPGIFEQKKETEYFKKQQYWYSKPQETCARVENFQQSKLNGENLRPLKMELPWRIFRKPDTTLKKKILCIPVSGRGRSKETLPKQVGKIVNTV
ncbi:uncharacterized protein LOC106672949 isoform X2 [Cimex lectularius]|uniref:CHHC U11-48K-type domain-containing protein n=1 Tax=Cimex lectularius TaxID=79782 RepID=A0A8I6SA76_CIMLE|nr:uncharacterized protein LOC106672949 isoform X2 [Cimex lectularius]